MKDRNLKFKKSYAEVSRVMDDKQTGRLIKAVSDMFLMGNVMTGTTRKSRVRSFL